MDAIICDISAWEYWRTPPALRDVEIPVDIARAKKPDGLGLEWLSEIPRLNIRLLTLAFAKDFSPTSRA